MLYLTFSAILSAGRADVFPWWGIGYGLLALHHIVRVYEVGRIPPKNSLIITLIFTPGVQRGRFGFFRG